MRSIDQKKGGQIITSKLVSLKHENFPTHKKCLVQVTVRCHVLPLKIEDKKCLKIRNTGEGMEKLTILPSWQSAH